MVAVSISMNVVILISMNVKMEPHVIITMVDIVAYVLMASKQIRMVIVLKPFLAHQIVVKDIGEWVTLALTSTNVQRLN